MESRFAATRNIARRAISRVVIGTMLCSTVPVTVLSARPTGDLTSRPVTGPETAVTIRACDRLAHRAISGVTSLVTDYVAAGGGAPGYCRVRGTIRRVVNFELQLPDQWNNKFLMAGCGGFCGSVLSQAPVFQSAVRRGYATVTTDTGHSSSNALDGRWAKDNPSAREDYSWRGVRDTTTDSKLLVRAYYGRNIEYSYFDGCSNGGRQGLVEASRFPADYDGIVAGAPARDVVGLTTFFAWTAAADADRAGNPILRASSIDLLSKAVSAACGDHSGLIERPRECRFDPRSLECRKDASSGCLEPAEVAVVEKFYRGPHDSAGRPLFASGEPYGSERFWRPDGSPHALQPLKMAAKGLVGYIASDPAPGEHYDPARFNFDHDVARIARIGKSMTPSADLERFAARRGKLILYQGTADQMVPPATTVQYYQAVTRVLGANASETVRLFLIPGMAHCANPPGSNAPGFDIGDIDPLTALEAWVERGKAPDTLPATRRDGRDEPFRKRLLCAYERDGRRAAKADACIDN